MAKQKTAHSAVHDFVALQEAFFLVLPVARVRPNLGAGTEKEAAEAAWRAYDAGVRLLTTSVDSLYRNPVFGESVAVVSESFLRWQRLRTALTGTFVAGLRQTFDLVSATELQVVREQQGHTQPSVPHGSYWCGSE